MLMLVLTKKQMHIQEDIFNNAMRSKEEGNEELKSINAVVERKFYKEKLAKEEDINNSTINLSSK